MANVKLSAAELKLVSDAGFILTKNNIIAKVYALFGSMAATYVAATARYPQIPENVRQLPPKISRGENYEGLPWVMLDYPRCFSKEQEFAIRTFFWWGNFCSTTLQVSGSYQQQLLPAIVQFSKAGLSANWFLCIHSGKWQHHFRTDNYQPLSLFPPAQISSLPFIKLAKKIPLSEWEMMETSLQDSFSTLLQLTGQN